MTFRNTRASSGPLDALLGRQTRQKKVCLVPRSRKSYCGCSSVGRASAFQAEGREFEPRRPLHRAVGVRRATGSGVLAYGSNTRTTNLQRRELMVVVCW